MYTYVHTCMHTYACVCVCVNVHMHMITYVCNMCMYVYSTYMHARMTLCMCASLALCSMHVYVCSMHVCIHATCTCNMYVLVRRMYIHRCTTHVHVCSMYVHVHVSMCAVCVCTYIHVCTHTYMCATAWGLCMYIYEGTCVDICVPCMHCRPMCMWAVQRQCSAGAGAGWAQAGSHYLNSERNRRVYYLSYHYLDIGVSL